MRKRLAFSIAATLVMAIIASNPSSVSAAAGDVTSTALTAPSAVSGGNLALAFNDGAGGSYQVYRSGQTRSLIRILPSGTVDTAFNSGSAVALGVPSALATTGVIRMTGMTHAGTQKWWTVSTASSNSSAAGISITSGDNKGTTSFTKTIDGATILAKCVELNPTAAMFQSPSLLARRNGGVWLQVLCIVGNTNIATFFPLTDTADFDATSKSFSAAAAHGGSASCALMPAVAADPTSKAPAPELWIIRTEHNFSENSSCVSGTNSPAQIAGVAGAYVALASLSVTADGTVSRTQIATSPALSTGGMRIDPGGRPVALASEITDNTKVKMFRLKAGGGLDNSVGTNGFRDLDTGTLPTGAVRLQTAIVGVVTTADRTYFAIQLYDSETGTYMNNITTPRVHGYRMAMASVADGWATGFGTRGIGARVTTTLPENWFSNGGINSTGTTVNAKGEPQNLTIGETTTSLNVWSTISGATGGGEGGSGLGGFTRDTGGAPSAGQSGTTKRVDSKIYSSLPASMQVNTAFTTFSASTARKLSLVSTTPTTCVVSHRHVIALAIGACSVSVVRKGDDSTVRTLQSTVTKKTSTSGSEITASKPLIFSLASARLTKTARGQIADLATSAGDMSAVVVVGHAAALTESPFNFAISRNRAEAVRAALLRAKVKAPITVTARGTQDLISNKKTEAAQAQNRRVLVYLIP